MSTTSPSDRLRASLNKTFRISIQDGRTFTGTFVCTDKAKHLILADALETKAGFERDVGMVRLFLSSFFALAMLLADWGVVWFVGDDSMEICDNCRGGRGDELEGARAVLLKIKSTLKTRVTLTVLGPPFLLALKEEFGTDIESMDPIKPDQIAEIVKSRRRRECADREGPQKTEELQIKPWALHLF